MVILAVLWSLTFANPTHTVIAAVAEGHTAYVAQRNTITAYDVATGRREWTVHGAGAPADAAEGGILASTATGVVFVGDGGRLRMRGNPCGNRRPELVAAVHMHGLALCKGPARTPYAFRMRAVFLSLPRGHVMRSIDTSLVDPGFSLRMLHLGAGRVGIFGLIGTVAVGMEAETLNLRLARVSPMSDRDKRKMEAIAASQRAAKVCPAKNLAVNHDVPGYRVWSCAGWGDPLTVIVQRH